MKLQNQTNSIIFSATLNSTPSLTVSVPAQTNTILICLSKGQTTDNSSFIVQTAPSSGIFATSGYIGGVLFVPNNSNAWANDSSISSGLYLTGGNNLSPQYTDASVYYSGFNTNSTTSCYGTMMNSHPITFLELAIGQSPTTMATQIKILTSSGATMASGAIKIYSVV